MILILNWLNGWRRDMDGWIVRARRETDDEATIQHHYGFVEESAVAVKWHRTARDLDTGKLRKETK